MDTLITYVNALFVVFTILLLIRILVSWLPRPPLTGIGRTLYDFVAQSTDWYLNIFRRFIPPLGMFDLSPIVGFFVLLILNNVVVGLLESIA
ncbi:MAG TPA: YggT family protein [Miltoncostaeaceae bacterium]|jgi:YggT family protein|nr:YggT family protein [Miltoncostaeaceae bacterium]